jgi:hypothetical protein
MRKLQSSALTVATPAPLPQLDDMITKTAVGRGTVGGGEHLVAAVLHDGPAIRPTPKT